MSLAAATRSEVTKQFSTAMWWILAVVLVVYVAMMTAGLGFVFGAQATGLIGGEEMALPGNVSGLLYSFASSLGYVFALLIGTLMVTNEFRHKTLTPTFLAVPKRARALFAKVLVGVLLGVLYGLIAVVTAVAAGAATLAGFGQDTGLSDSDTWALFGRILLSLVLWTLIGVGVGTLVRNQVAAIVGVLAFTQFIEPIVRLAAAFVEGLGDVANYLPGAASDALVGYSFLQLGVATGTAAPLEWWAGGIVLAAYALVFLVIGHFASWRRDVA